MARKTVQNVIDSMTKEQKNVLYAIVGQAFKEAGNNEEDYTKHEEANNIINTVDEIRDHAHRIYSGFYDILKSKGMTDEEIDKTNLHLHLNSIGAKSAYIRHIICNERRM